MEASDSETVREVRHQNLMQVLKRIAATGRAHDRWLSYLKTSDGRVLDARLTLEQRRVKEDLVTQAAEAWARIQAALEEALTNPHDMHVRIAEEEAPIAGYRRHVRDLDVMLRTVSELERAGQPTARVGIKPVIVRDRTVERDQFGRICRIVEREQADVAMDE
jgi:capsid protein